MGKIISFGCSYTAGAEILDHELDPLSDHIKRTRGGGYWLKHYRARDPHIQSDLDRRELELSWAGQLAQLVGCGLDNRALGGSSLAQIVHRVERAWYQGELDSCELVLVGVTGYARSVFWREPAEPHSWILGWPRDWPNPKWHKLTVMEIFSERYMISLHLTYLLRLVQISDRLQGRLKMFDMMGMADPRSRNWLGKTNLEPDRWQEIVASTHARFDVSMDTMTGPDQRYGGGHPRIEVHEQFARWARDQLAL